MECKLFALLLAGFIICQAAAQPENCKEQKLANKVVLVTGASSGIGADAARHLASLGASVSLIGRNESRLNKVRQEILDAGSPEPLVIVADITQKAWEIVANTVSHFGKLDILVNNAGIMKHYTNENVNMTDYDLIWNTNVRAMVEITKYAIPHLKKTKGNILNLASIDGIITLEANMVYGVTKAAIIHLTKSNARDLGKEGIRVNAVAPGMVDTPIFYREGEMTEEEAAKFLIDNGKLNPVGRAGVVSDISAAIEYLTSDAASFVSGSVLTVDGGQIVAMISA